MIEWVLTNSTYQWGGCHLFQPTVTILINVMVLAVFSLSLNTGATSLGEVVSVSYFPLWAVHAFQVLSWRIRSLVLSIHWSFRCVVGFITTQSRGSYMLHFLRLGGNSQSCLSVLLKVCGEWVVSGHKGFMWSFDYCTKRTDALKLIMENDDL